jgi:acyl carrier protein
MTMFGRRKKQTTVDGALTEESLRGWLVQHLADRVQIPAAEVDPDRTFEEYGLDSRVAVQVSGALEKVVERRLSPGLLYEHQTVNELTGYLATELHLSDRAS